MSERGARLSDMNNMDSEEAIQVEKEFTLGEHGDIDIMTFFLNMFEQTMKNPGKYKV